MVGGGKGKKHTGGPLFEWCDSQKGIGRQVKKKGRSQRGAYTEGEAVEKDYRRRRISRRKEM